MPRHALSIYTFAEIGVILLMFGVGLHFHFDELLAVRGVAFPGALGQSFVATLLGCLVALGMTEFILRQLGAGGEQIDRERDRIRDELFDSPLTIDILLPPPERHPRQRPTGDGVQVVDQTPS